MSVLDQIRLDLNEALKARDEVKISTLRFVISKTDNARIAKGTELTDEEINLEINKDAKRHKESIDAFEKAGRGELVSKEKAELDILLKYLPEQMGDAEIGKLVDSAVQEVGARSLADLGKVMSVVMGRAKGQADGTRVSAIVKEKLSGSSR